MTRDHLTHSQARLNALGYDSGTPDGVAGYATSLAICNCERYHGLISNGHFDCELLAALSVD